MIMFFKLFMQVYNKNLFYIFCYLELNIIIFPVIPNEAKLYDHYLNLLNIYLDLLVTDKTFELIIFFIIFSFNFIS